MLPNLGALSLSEPTGVKRVVGQRRNILPSYKEQIHILRQRIERVKDNRILSVALRKIIKNTLEKTRFPSIHLRGQLRDLLVVDQMIDAEIEKFNAEQKRRRQEEKDDRAFFEAIEGKKGDDNASEDSDAPRLPSFKPKRRAPQPNASEAGASAPDAGPSSSAGDTDSSDEDAPRLPSFKPKRRAPQPNASEAGASAPDAGPSSSAGDTDSSDEDTEEDTNVVEDNGSSSPVTREASPARNAEAVVKKTQRKKRELKEVVNPLVLKFEQEGLEANGWTLHDKNFENHELAIPTDFRGKKDKQNHIYCDVFLYHKDDDICVYIECKLLSENGFSHALGQVLRYKLKSSTRLDDEVGFYALRTRELKCTKSIMIIALNKKPTNEQIREAGAFGVRCWWVGQELTKLLNPDVYTL